MFTCRCGCLLVAVDVIVDVYGELLVNVDV